jgi:hypothetical protein
MAAKAVTEVTGSRAVMEEKAAAVTDARPENATPLMAVQAAPEAMAATEEMAAMQDREVRAFSYIILPRLLPIRFLALRPQVREAQAA